MAPTGTLVAPIHRTYALKDVPEALRHFGDGDKLGKLAISTDGGTPDDPSARHSDG